MSRLFRRSLQIDPPCRSSARCSTGRTSFSLADGSDLRRLIDTALLAMREDGTYDRISETWFGKT